MILLPFQHVTNGDMIYTRAGLNPNKGKNLLLTFLQYNQLMHCYEDFLNIYEKSELLSFQFMRSLLGIEQKSWERTSETQPERGVKKGVFLMFIFVLHDPICFN